jgi:hypothetical protein
MFKVTTTPAGTSWALVDDHTAAWSFVWADGTAEASIPSLIWEGPWVCFGSDASENPIDCRCPYCH